MPSLPHPCALNLLEYGPASHLFHAESPPGLYPGGLSTMGPAPGWYGRSAGGQRQPRPAPVIASDQFWRAPAVPAKVHLPTDRGDLESASTEWAIHPGPASNPVTYGSDGAIGHRSRASSSSKRKCVSCSVPIVCCSYSDRLPAMRSYAMIRHTEQTRLALFQCRGFRQYCPSPLHFPLKCWSIPGGIRIVTMWIS